MELFKITEETYPVKLHLAYATKDNFMGRVMYKNPECYLRMDAKPNLEKAIEISGKLGYRLKIFDAYRPVVVQKAFWDFIQDDRYVSNPNKNGGGPHCRGVAIDLTLIDSNGNELEMGAAFDEFAEIAHQGNTEISVEALRNRSILNGIMVASGFHTIKCEWWHFQLPNAWEYSVIDHDELQLEMV